MKQTIGLRWRQATNLVACLVIFGGAAYLGTRATDAGAAEVSCTITINCPGDPPFQKSCTATGPEADCSQGLTCKDGEGQTTLSC